MGWGTLLAVSIGLIGLIYGYRVLIGSCLSPCKKKSGSSRMIVHLGSCWWCPSSTLEILRPTPQALNPKPTALYPKS